MTTTTTNTNDQHPVAPDHPTRIFAQWGLPHTVTPRFGARLIQEHHRLHFLSDRASLIGEWEEVAIDRLDQAFPGIINSLEAKLLTGDWMPNISTASLSNTAALPTKPIPWVATDIST